MGFLDEAKNIISEHGDQVDEGLDKVGELAKSKFAGHDDQIDGLIGQVKEHTGESEPAAAPAEPAQ